MHCLKLKTNLIFYILIFFGIGFARILHVGPGKPYPKPSDAAGVVADGDTVDIDAVEYVGDAAIWYPDNLLLRAVGGGRAHLRANGAYVQGKGIWVTKGWNVTVENIEFSEAAVPDENGAGIRADGGTLTIRNCYFHDNENGILGGDLGGTMTIEYCEFAYNGFGDGQTHNVYVGHPDTLIFRYNYSHHAKIGHNLKTRAKVNYILYNRLMDEDDGTSSYAIDIPNGGLTYIIGNLIQQGPDTDNNGSIVAYGLEGLGTGRIHNIYVINNSIVNDYGVGGRIFSIVSNASESKIINNILVTNGGVVGGGGSSFISNWETDDPKFVDMANYNYRLTANATGAIDQGNNPGVGVGFDLMPTSQYVHPHNRQDRTLVNTIDIGAYEYGVVDTTSPSAPTGLEALPQSEREILLTWLPSSDPQSGIVHYNIYRDGIYVNQSAATSFTDGGLHDNTTYIYRVSAVNSAGLESEKSDTASAKTFSDITPPTILSILAEQDPTQIKIIYDEPVDSVSATSISNYSIDHGIMISSAVISSNFNIVTLSTSSHSAGILYTLTVNNVMDQATVPNVIAPNSQKSYSFIPNLLITNLTASSGQPYEVNQDLNNDSLAYIDRIYTYDNVPISLQGKTYIKTANNDKLSQGNQFLTFDANQSVIVYVAHDDYYTIKPDWLNSFVDTGEDLVIDQTTMSLFKKTFTSGNVVLGGNVNPAQATSQSMYTVIVEGAGVLTVASNEDNIPVSFDLQPNYPNPFNPTTSITYQLPNRSDVVLEIFDGLGKKVKTLVKEPQEAGVHHAEFDGRDLASGVYIYRLQAGRVSMCRKMELLK